MSIFDGNKAMDQVEPPKPLPMGTYNCVVSEISETVSSVKGTKGMLVKFLVQTPDLDVSEAEITRYGGLEKIANKTLSDRYWDTPESEWRIREFFEKSCRLSVTGKFFGELSQEALGAAVKVVIAHRADKNDAEKFYTDVKKVIAAV